MPDETNLTAEELKAIGKQHTKEWAKRVGAKLVVEEDDGNIELWVYGKTHSKKYKTVNYVTATKRASWSDGYKSFKEEVLDTKKFAETRLQEDWDIQPDEHLHEANSGSFKALYYYLDNSSNPDSQYKEDDVPTLLAKMIYFADLILNKNTDHDFQLRFASILGQTVAQHDYITKTAPKNKSRAQKPRHPEINQIIKNLSKQDEKSKDLWDVFISNLENELNADVEDIRINNHDSKTWSANICYYSSISEKEISKSLNH